MIFKLPELNLKNSKRVSLQLKEDLWLEETQQILCAFALFGLLYMDEQQAARGFIVFCKKNYDTATTRQEKIVIDF